MFRIKIFTRGDRPTDPLERVKWLKKDFEFLNWMEPEDIQWLLETAQELLEKKDKNT